MKQFKGIKILRKKYRCLIFLLFSFLLSGCKQEGMLMSSDTDKNETEDFIISSETEQRDENDSQKVSEDVLVYVYVCGQVKNPGVYSLDSDARICDALNAAGGLTEDANDVALNQAEHISDGMTIYVPGNDEEISGGNTQYPAVEDGLVNINTADKETLMTVPGIGESKADAIIAYRSEHGMFEKIDDLMNIPGIKDGVFQKIKEYIKVTN